MLQLAMIRQQPDFVIERLLIKNFDASAAIGKILELDAQRKRLQTEMESEQAGLNAISREVGQLIAKGEKEKAEEKKREVTSLKSKLSYLPDAIKAIEDQLHQLLVTLPNLPSDRVAPGKTPNDNVVVREGGAKPVLPANALAHWDLARKYNLIDFELGK